MSEKNGKSEFELKNGVWTRAGVLYPCIARIKPDPCLKNRELREEFPPHSFVHYCTNDMEKEEIADTVLYFANVQEVDGDKRHRIALSMLEFTKTQKAEIMKKKKFPDEAFEKAHMLRLEPDDLDPDSIGSSYGIFDPEDMDLL